jgi:hypothetical protein
MTWAIGATLRRRVGGLAWGTDVWIKACSEDDPNRVEVAPRWGRKRPVWCDLADLEAFAVLPHSGSNLTWPVSLHAERFAVCLEQAAIEARQALAATGRGRIPRRRGP